MLILLLKLLHIIVAVFLILVVLLQTGKGAEMGAAFGGASQTLFGGGGPAGFMAKLTTSAAVLFMITSLSLAYFSAGGRASAPSMVPVSSAPIEAPAGLPAAPQTETPAGEAGAAGAETAR